MNPYQAPTEKSELPEAVREQKRRLQVVAVVVIVAVPAICVIEWTLGENALSYIFFGFLGLCLLFDAIYVVRRKFFSGTNSELDSVGNSRDE